MIFDKKLFVHFSSKFYIKLPKKRNKTTAKYLLYKLTQLR